MINMHSRKLRVAVLPLLLVAMLFAAGTNGGDQRAAAAPGGPASHIVVFAEGVDPDSTLADLGKAHGASVERVYRHAVNGAAIIIPPGRAEAIAADSRILSIEPNRRVTLNELPTGVDRVDAELNAVAQIDGVDVRVDVDVAVIDTGVDLDHPDLNVVANTNCARGGPGGGDCRDGDGDDGNGHGTHVAGTIAALDNGSGVVGMAPGARIWGVRVLDNRGSGWLSWIVGGVDWVTANADQIEVANMSLSWQGNSSAARTAIQNSVAAGVVYVVAAGNDTLDVYGDDGNFGTGDDIEPASYPEVATVAALSDTDGAPGGNGPASSWGGRDRDGDGIDDGADDSFAFFSNFSASAVAGNPVNSPGKAIDLIMPGVDITSTWIGGGYDTISGTSMASPHAAGLAALHIAGNGRAGNATEVYAIRQALIDSGVAQNSADGLSILNDPDGNLENIGWPVAGSFNGAPSVNITSPADGTEVSGSESVTADAFDTDGNVTQVEFFVDGASIGVDTNGGDGWSASWDTTAYADGNYSVSATATDDGGQTAGDSISVIVNNVDDAPSVAITSPADGSTVSATQLITADASDDNGVTQVEFFVDGVSVGVDTDGGDGWSASWDTTGVVDGASVVLTADATDNASQTVTSASVSVTVDNSGPTTMHVGDLDGSKNVKGKGGKWEALVTVTVLDAENNPVAGASVAVSVSGAISGTGTGTTGSDGTITFTTGTISGASVTFVVDNVSHSSLSYDSGANHDPDGDSDGTTITVSK